MIGSIFLRCRKPLLQQPKPLAVGFSLKDQVRLRKQSVPGGLSLSLFSSLEDNLEFEYLGVDL